MIENQPDENRCERMAEPMINEIRLKARDSESSRFRNCAAVLDEDESGTDYEKLMRFIVACEREADGSAELTVTQRNKASDLLAISANQYIIRKIDDVYKKFFT